ncbi:MAG: HAD-IA family hydrolase [Phycisphaerales bacterium]
MTDDIRHICFDWGGVILKICRTWEEGCASAGVETRTKKAGAACYKKMRAIEPRYQTGQMSDKAFFRSISKASDEVYTIEEVEKIHHGWLLEEYDGVDELIDELNEYADLTTGLLSNTNALHWARMEEDSPSAFAIEHKHGSHLFGLAKPDEKTFAAYERRVNASGAQILFFDDSPEHIESARAFGWNAEQIDYTKCTATQMRGHLEKLMILEPGSV